VTTPSRPDATGLLRTAAFALLFAGAAVVGRLTVVEGTGVNLVWPAAGVGALWLLLQRGRATFVLDCALLVAVVLATDLLTGEDLLVSGGLAAVNLGQAGLVVLLYRRLAGSTGAAGPLLLDMRDLGGLLLATGIATTAGAAVGTVVLAVADGSWSVLGLVVWQARNGAAVLVVVALGLRVRQLLLTRRGPVVDGMLPFRAPGGWRAVELVLAVAASVLGNVAVFHWMPEYPIAFPLFALTAWVALRFDTGLTVLRTAAVSVVAVVYTLQGEGPFAAVDDVLVRAGIVQAYVALGAALGLALALNRDERLVLVVRLRDAVDYSEERHRQVEVMARASRTVLLAEDPRAAICAAVREAVGADGAYLLEPDGEGHLVSTAVDGLDLPPLRFSTDPSASLTARVFEEGAPYFASHVADEEGVSSDLVEHLGVASAAWQPAVLGEDKVVALIGILWRQPVDVFCATTRGVLQVLGNEAARAIERGNHLAELARAADRDQLTGLANRRRWDEMSTIEVARAQRSRLPLTLLLLDLDHFKAYNDTFGHAAGDVLLHDFAAAATECLRDGDLIARWGGEEFVVALPDCTDEEARPVAERIIAAVPFGQSATVGLAQWCRGETAQDTLARADAALYAGKDAGRARAVLAAQPAVVVG
jgi:diguanylate cyclase (GGDEF)-like protein